MGAYLVTAAARSRVGHTGVGLVVSVSDPVTGEPVTGLTSGSFEVWVETVTPQVALPVSDLREIATKGYYECHVELGDVFAVGTGEYRALCVSVTRKELTSTPGSQRGAGKALKVTHQGQTVTLLHSNPRLA